ncbi:hypothetical protein WEH80_16180 [Actinomycetes bacterium KLBMP 9759]
MRRPRWLHWLRQLFEPLRANADEFDDVDPRAFVRAVPAAVLVEEVANYQQDIGIGRSVESCGPPTGTIKLRVPYDGYEHFGRKAADDAAAVLQARGGPDRSAVFGHLALVGYERTDLADLLSLSSASSSVELQVPIRSTRLPTIGSLNADTAEHRWSLDYQVRPDTASVVPITVHVDISDPGHGDEPFTFDEIAGMADSDDFIARVDDAIKQTGGFRPHLTLAITVLLTLPPRRDRNRASDMKPSVRSVRIQLPSGISLPASSVRFGSGWGVADASLHLDGASGRLDWPGPELMGPQGSAGEPRKFEAERMTLVIEHPGELFRQQALDIDVEVEIPGELLSGTEFRYFDAVGDTQPLELRSVVTMHSEVQLYDAFAKRVVTPFQYLVYDEVIPDSLRFTDVRAALVDQRFEILGEEQLPPTKKRRERRMFVASRTDGPHPLLLVVYVEGHRHPTRRRAQQPAGHRYTTKFESGSLHLYIRGVAYGDTSRIMTEIAMLQRSLGDRFRKMKAYR